MNVSLVKDEARETRRTARVRSPCSQLQAYLRLCV